MSLKIAKLGCCATKTSKGRDGYAEAYTQLFKKRLEIASKLVQENPVKNANRAADFACEALSMNLSTRQRNQAKIIATIIRMKIGFPEEVKWLDIKPLISLIK